MTEDKSKTAIIGGLGLSSSLAVGAVATPTYTQHTAHTPTTSIEQTVQAGPILNIVIQLVIGLVTLIKLLKKKKDA